MSEIRKIKNKFNKEDLISVLLDKGFTAENVKKFIVFGRAVDVENVYRKGGFRIGIDSEGNAYYDDMFMDNINEVVEEYITRRLKRSGYRILQRVSKKGEIVLEVGK